MRVRQHVGWVAAKDSAKASPNDLGSVLLLFVQARPLGLKRSHRPLRLASGSRRCSLLSAKKHNLHCTSASIKGHSAKAVQRAPLSLSRQARQATWSCNAPALHSHCRRRCSSPPSRPCHTNPYSQTRKKPGTASVLSLAPHPCTHKRALLLRLHSSPSRLMDVRARRGVTARRPRCRAGALRNSLFCRPPTGVDVSGSTAPAVLQGTWALGAQEHPNK